MAVPFGGAEPYYGTNPIAFSAPGKGAGRILLLIWQPLFKHGEKSLMPVLKTEQLMTPGLLTLMETNNRSV